ASLGDRILAEAMGLARRARRKAREAVDPAAAARDAAGSPMLARDALDPATLARAERSVAGAGENGLTGSAASMRSTTERLALTPPAPSDPFALDARLVDAMRVLRTIDPKIGRLLRVVVDQRAYKSFGYRAFDDYVRERLGLSARKAWALLKIEKATLR